MDEAESSGKVIYSHGGRGAGGRGDNGASMPGVRARACHRVRLSCVPGTGYVCDLN